MTNFVRLLEYRERLERYLVAETISRISRAPSWSKQPSTFVCAVLVTIVLLVYLSSAPSFRVVYKLVEPGHYRPQQCSEWKFEAGTEHQLEEGLHQLAITAETLNISIMPGNQMGLPFCVIQVDKEQLLNPRISVFEGQSSHFTVNPRGFCSADSEFKVDLTPAITLSWTDPTSQLQHYRRFTNPKASELQVAILILKGENICM